MTNRLTDMQLDQIEKAARRAPYQPYLSPSDTVLQLVAEIRALRARVAELEKSHIDVTTLSCGMCFAAWDYIEIDGEAAAL